MNMHAHIYIGIFTRDLQRAIVGIVVTYNYFYVSIGLAGE